MGVKTDPKSTSKRRRNLRAKKLRLGSDLGRFWFVFGGCRGGIFVDFLLVFALFRGNRRFRKKSFQDASWVDLGSIWVAKAVVLGGLGESSWG